MSTLDKARDTQVRNIGAKTGRTMAQLRTLFEGSGLAKHGELRSFAMEKLGLGSDAARQVSCSAAGAAGSSAGNARPGIPSGPRARAGP